MPAQQAAKSKMVACFFDNVGLSPTDTRKKESSQRGWGYRWRCQKEAGKDQCRTGAVQFGRAETNPWRMQLLSHSRRQCATRLLPLRLFVPPAHCCVKVERLGGPTLSISSCLGVGTSSSAPCTIQRRGNKPFSMQNCQHKDRDRNSNQKRKTSKKEMF